jgi:hypothetical protein
MVQRFLLPWLQPNGKFLWLVGLLLLLLPIGAGGMAFWALRQMDGAECRLAQGVDESSDSTKLYCAQVLADRRDPDDLAEAIRLAAMIAPDHPLSQDRDRLVQQWSERLLELADATYHDGKLEDALYLLKAIPPQSQVYKSAARRTDTWQADWKQAEEIYEAAQTALGDRDLIIAQAEARKLLKIPNDHWRTTRFQALVNEIQTAKEDKNAEKAAAARQQAKPAPPANPLTTDDLIARWNREQEGESAAHLQKAQRLASGGDVTSLRDAISEAELVFSGTSHYAQAQALIAGWNRQIEITEDRPYLDRAVALASQGDMASLQAAISEANNIYFGRSLYAEAQRKIDGWTTQVRELSDRQYRQDLPPSPPRPEVDYRLPPP